MNETYETKLGTYCWPSDPKSRGECVDTAGEVKLLEDEDLSTSKLECKIHL